jgi:2-polyprenyl-3-methyl-5-hydroxy-6-metoxy-1,4-benzoquinol methylase
MADPEFTFTRRTNCPVCGSTNAETLFQERFDSGKTGCFIKAYYIGGAEKVDFGNAFYQLDRCSTCRFIFQRYVLDSSSSQLFYETFIDPHASLSKRRRGSYVYYKNLAQSMRHIHYLFPERLPIDLRVLDFGMGWGHWLMMAAAHGFDAYGLEISDTRVAYARNRGLNAFSSLNQLSGKFHFINLDQVLEHVDNPAHILATLAGLLVPDGVLRIAVPNAVFLDWRIRHGLWKIGKNEAQPLEHINSFTNKSLSVLLSSLGLDRLGLSRFGVMRNRLRLLPCYIFHRFKPAWYFGFRKD